VAIWIGLRPPGTANLHSTVVDGGILAVIALAVGMGCLVILVIGVKIALQGTESKDRPAVLRGLGETLRGFATIFNGVFSKVVVGLLSTLLVAVAAPVVVAIVKHKPSGNASCAVVTSSPSAGPTTESSYPTAIPCPSPTASPSGS
jgi:hypothetical protein